MTAVDLPVQLPQPTRPRPRRYARYRWQPIYRGRHVTTLPDIDTYQETQ